MNKYKPFNINARIRVKLTDLGRAIHKRNHEQLVARTGRPFDYIPPTEDSDGWSEWQLWRAMQEFGSHYVIGHPEPFEPSMQIEQVDDV